jgi:hypothetical protein
MYSSALTTNSQTYGRNGCKLSNYYHESIQVNVVAADFYILSSNSNVDTYGYIYKDKFNPLHPSANLLLQTDEGCNHHQFKLVADLQTNTTYVLVVTTAAPNVTGVFSIFAFGPNYISLNRIGEYLVFVLFIA